MSLICQRERLLNLDDFQFSYDMDLQGKSVNQVVA